MNGRARAFGLMLFVGFALGLDSEPVAPSPDETRPSLRETLERKVAERDGLQAQIAALKQQRTIFLAYDALAALAVLWLGRRLLGGSEKRREVPIAASAAVAAETPDTESDPFGEDEAVAPTQQPKTGRATITVRDGSTQAVVASGDVATRRVVKRVNASADDTQATQKSLPESPPSPEEASDKPQVRTGRRSKSASFTAPPAGGGSSDPGSASGPEQLP